MKNSKQQCNNLVSVCARGMEGRTLISLPITFLIYPVLVFKLHFDPHSKGIFFCLQSCMRSAPSYYYMSGHPKLPYSTTSIKSQGFKITGQIHTSVPNGKLVPHSLLLPIAAPIGGGGKKKSLNILHSAVLPSSCNPTPEW